MRSEFSDKQDLKNTIDQKVAITQIYDFAYEKVKEIQNQISDYNVSAEEVKRVIHHLSKPELVDEALVYKANLLTLQALLWDSRILPIHYRYFLAVGALYQDYLAGKSDAMHDQLGHLNKIADNWLESDDPTEDRNDQKFDERRDDDKIN